MAVCSLPQRLDLPVGETATDITAIKNTSFILSDVGNVYSFGNNTADGVKSTTLGMAFRILRSNYIFSNLSTFEIRTPNVRIRLDNFFRICFQKLRLAPKLFQYQNGPKRLSCANHDQDRIKSPKNRVYPLMETDSWDVLPGIRPNGLHSSQTIPDGNPSLRINSARVPQPTETKSGLKKPRRIPGPQA